MQPQTAQGRSVRSSVLGSRSDQICSSWPAQLVRIGWRRERANFWPPVVGGVKNGRGSPFSCAILSRNLATSCPGLADDMTHRCSQSITWSTSDDVEMRPVADDDGGDASAGSQTQIEPAAKSTTRKYL